MIKRPPPPMIIFMDLLLILMFVALLQEKKETYDFVYRVPLNWKNIAIRYENAGKTVWFKNRPISNDGFSVSYNCDDKLKKIIKLPKNNKCFAYIYGSLGVSVAKVLFQACVADRCGKLLIPIGNGDTIDKQDMLNLNPQLEGNPHFRRR